MLVSINKDHVKFCELVEHPGGPDGGEFPQYEEFSVSNDGTKCFYKTGFPECPTDTFADEDPEDYIKVLPSHKNAIQNLEAYLEYYYGDSYKGLPIYKRFCDAAGFEILFEE